MLLLFVCFILRVYWERCEYLALRVVLSQYEKTNRQNTASTDSIRSTEPPNTASNGSTHSNCCEYWQYLQYRTLAYCQFDQNLHCSTPECGLLQLPLLGTSMHVLCRALLLIKLLNRSIDTPRALHTSEYTGSTRGGTSTIPAQTYLRYAPHY